MRSAASVTGPREYRWMRSARIGSRTTGTAMARATPSRVTSSCVGPTPPEVNTTSKSRLNSATTSAMSWTSSGITVIRRTSTPSARSSRQR